MKYGTIPGLDKKISRLVQGCMMLGDGDGLPASFAILDDAFQRGVTTFDNGHIYGGGACEKAFGKWIDARGNREQVVILDKGCHHNDVRQRVTPYDIKADIADSLARLGQDSIDLWMFHRDDASQPVEALIDTLNAELEAGRITAFGASNWSVARVKEANDYAERAGLVGFSAVSPNFSLARQLDEPWANCQTISGPEHAADRAWLAGSGLGIFTWSSLARGFLTGRLTRENFDRVKDQFEEHTIRCYVSEDNWQRLERATKLAKEKNLQVAQIALAYVLNQDFDSYALVGGVSAAEAEANAEAVDIELSAAECAWLDLRSDSR